MSKKTPLICRLILLACLLAILPACGPSNAVRLLAPPMDGQVVPPAPNAPRVTIVRFEDKRPDQFAIGQRSDGSSFTTQDQVNTWISRALTDEMTGHGMQISYATSTDKAIAANPDFLVIGEVNEVWLRENSATELSLSMSVRYSIHNRQKRIRQEEINNTLTHNGLPSGSAADNLLRDGVRDLARDMARKIDGIIKAKK